MNKLLLPLVFVAGLTLVACSALKDFFDDNTTIVKLAVQQVTLKNIEREPTPTLRSERAKKIKVIADSIVKELETGIIITPDQLRAALAIKYDLSKLEVSDQLLVNTLLDAISTSVTKEVSIDAKASGLVDLKQVFTWVSEAASLYIIGDNKEIATILSSNAS